MAASEQGSERRGVLVRSFSSLEDAVAARDALAAAGTRSAEGS